MAEDHLKVVLKSEVMEHSFAGDKPLSMVSIYSSNSSQDEDEESLTHTMGLRSPTGGASRGRSVKEIEEQLSNLKKENFNLKLRIYFLEEKMGTNFTLDKDNIVKKNIELQIEIANLQKEVQEKHQLLCQAVKAMELEEEEHKKYISSKEEQLSMCQQEIEDLRMQLQDTKFESDGISIKSDTTGFCSGRATNSGHHVADLQERIKTLEDELLLEKENNASLQFVIGQAETWKIRYESMQKELQVKDEIIQRLTNEIENANKQISNMIIELKECQEKYETTNKENHALHKTIQADNKKIEEVANQVLDLRKKYSMTKADLEREQKKCERIKIICDMKVTEIEEENQKQKMKIRDLQTKLETAMMEIRKNQNLAVLKSPKKTSNITNVDKNSISVQDSATSPRVAEKDALHVSVKEEDQEQNQNSSSLSASKFLSPYASPPAEKFNVKYFEDLLNTNVVGDNAGGEKILSHFQILKKEHHLQSQKITKLKGEQMKACEIIKTMIESRNKANDEINLLKEHIKELEHELESVVTKQTNDGGDTLSLKQKITELNITAAGKNEDEVDINKKVSQSVCQ